jgi:hypothetical protein
MQSPRVLDIFSPHPVSMHAPLLTANRTTTAYQMLGAISYELSAGSGSRSQANEQQQQQ